MPDGLHSAAFGPTSRAGLLPTTGGRRPWFRCPCGRRVAKLYVGADHRFACRRCLGLTYASQRDVPRHRHLGQAQKIRRRLGAPAHAITANGKIFAGRKEDIEAHTQEALRLSPRNTCAYHWVGMIGRRPALNARRIALFVVQPESRRRPARWGRTCDSRKAPPPHCRANAYRRGAYGRARIRGSALGVCRCRPH